jgi:hypothetical protein
MEGSQDQGANCFASWRVSRNITVLKDQEAETPSGDADKMAGRPILDAVQLLHDLRLAVGYAARAGVLVDASVIETLKGADNALSAGQTPDVYTLVPALNSVGHSIEPMTLADLESGRDPFLPDNRRRAGRLLLMLTAFALLILLLIGYSMNALQAEQQVLRDIAQIQELQPQLKLTSLRKLAEYDQPLSSHTGLYDEYHSKAADLREISSRMSATYASAAQACQRPLIVPLPWSSNCDNRFEVQSDVGGSLSLLEKLRSAVTTIPPATAGAAKASQTSAAIPPTAPTAEAKDKGSAAPIAGAFCAEDGAGNMLLPVEAASYPKWMKDILADYLSDFCFQLKILSPSGEGTMLSESFDQLSFLPRIREKVALRTVWLLPFLYGLLGSAVYLMRNSSNVRTPAMNWLATAMRLSLGGVAGIVIGWFSGEASSSIASTATLSIPFALAFLMGYGIDVLFSLLDRLNRAIGDVRGVSKP